MKVLKLTILLTLILFYTGFAQETDVTIEEAKEKSKGLLHELFMFKLAADVIETRQLISDNELGDSVENYMNNYDNALFFISTLDYDFFWNSVLGRKKYKVPSSKLFLESKDKFLSDNVVNTSIDFDIVLTPQWEDPATEDKLKNYKVKITPGNYTNLDYTENDKAELSEIMNSSFSVNVATPKYAPVNVAVFDGLDKLKLLSERSTLSSNDILEIKEYAQRFVPGSEDDKFDLKFELKENNTVVIEKVRLEIYKKAGDKEEILHKSDDITDFANPAFEWNGQIQTEDETEEANYVTYDDNPLYARVVASEKAGGKTFTAEGEFKVKGDLVEVSCASFFETGDDSRLLEIEYILDNDNSDDIKLIAGKILITDKNGEKIDEVNLSGSGEAIESDILEWNPKSFKEKINYENCPIKIKFIAATDAEFNDKYTANISSYLNPLKISTTTPEKTFAPGIEDYEYNKLGIEYEINEIEGVDLSNAKIQILDKNNIVIVESLEEFSKEKEEIKWDGKKIDENYIINNDCDFKIQLVAGDNFKFVAEINSDVDPDAESWRSFKYNESDWSITFDEYKEIKDVYLTDFDNLGLDETDPLNYINENFVDAEFLGRNITVNKRFLYVLRKIEEGIGRGINGSSNSNTYNEYKGYFSEISSDARMTTIETQEGDALSNHSLGFAIDFDAIKNPMITSINMYLFNWIVTDLYLYGVKSDKEKMKSAQNSFKSRVIDENITINTIQFVYNELNSYEIQNNNYQIVELINNPIGNDLEQIINTLKGLMENPEENYNEIIQRCEEYWISTNTIGERILQLKDILPKYNKGLFLEYHSKSALDETENYIISMEEQTLKTLAWLSGIIDYYKSNSLEQWLIRIQEFFLGKTDEINTSYNCASFKDLTDRISLIKAKIKEENSGNTSLKTFGDNLKSNVENAETWEGNKLFDFGYFDLHLNIVTKIYTENDYTYWGGLYRNGHDWMHFEIRQNNQKKLLEITDKDIDDYLKKFE